MLTPVEESKGLDPSFTGLLLLLSVQMPVATSQTGKSIREGCNLALLPQIL